MKDGPKTLTTIHVPEKEKHQRNRGAFSRGGGVGWVLLGVVRVGCWVRSLTYGGCLPTSSSFCGRFALDRLWFAIELHVGLGFGVVGVRVVGWLCWVVSSPSSTTAGGRVRTLHLIGRSRHFLSRELAESLGRSPPLSPLRW